MCVVGSSVVCRLWCEKCLMRLLFLLYMKNSGLKLLVWWKMLVCNI